MSTSLLLHQGVVPNLNLANAIGCAQRWDESQACFVPVVDEWGASSVPGVTIAGDGAGIAGAPCSAGAWRARRVERCFRAGRVGCRRRAIPPRPHPEPSAPAGCADADSSSAMYEPAPHYRVPRGDTDRLPLRGGERRSRSPTASARLPGTEPDEELSALRHGPMPGPLVRIDCHRADCARAGVSPARGRLLPAALPDQADHARRAGVAAANRRFTAGRCASAEITRSDAAARRGAMVAAPRAPKPVCRWNLTSARQAGSEIGPLAP